MTLHLVRHGRPLVDRTRPAAEWELDPAGFDDVWALRESGRLPEDAAWFCSPEPKAVATAQLLTEGDVGIVEDLREQVRDSTDWLDDHDAVVRLAFAQPDRPAHPGWEPLATCRDRTLTAVRRILDVHAGEDVVLVGHGTAWTLVVAGLTGAPPDLVRWAALAMPDVLVVPPA
ncbi:histidine phosphatase family protein [Nocardioides sp. cx-173]|uniref:histidine phosphatase family protein n=1 Tax=Nocardioides sp. cx-173 TaxID=2898796 RepID=UPI001E60CBAC|nr:histidine phosphatase family protein [Nocardioides sp. cx-173]MCD4524803.1 phosphoglycerate mutase family protein [Nocardioides sp. cx-173]UGB43309.1 phosphoglycerate mutase family protein [Nocardioides sp. cx-173]